MRKNSQRMIILLTAVWLSAGCARTEPITYYQLTPLHLEQHLAAQASEGVLGIGPITLPEYLDRPQIVSRLGANRLELADRHRWAEPLGDNIAAVLQTNLARELGSDRPLLYPWPPGLSVDRQITVEVIHCEGGDDEVRFEACWTIRDREGKVLLPQQHTRQRIKVAQPSDYERQVTALSEALARFSEEIAATLREKAAESGGDGGTQH